MAWWNFIGDALKGGKDVAEVFVENKENKGQRQHAEQMADVNRDLASLSQFSDEFHSRQNRTWWDSFVDGLNRLPRPLLTIAIVSFFVLAPLDPARFLEIAKAYELMPPGYWALLSIIIGFYFGGRMQLKAQDFTIKKSAVQAAKELVQIKKEFRQLDDDKESTESKIFDTAKVSAGKVLKNSVVQQWLDSQKK
ncbi:Holin of 3TMs, for gene-transfer release [Alteromonadaceae bacterium Bs31]|nr:Holin of 3TMs, for gene-transfer release [Alteromonadaceae bacterium Bs31]